MIKVLLAAILATVLLDDGRVRIEGEKSVDIAKSMTIKVTPRGIDLRNRFRGFAVADDYEDDQDNSTSWLLTPKPSEESYSIAPFAFEGKVRGPVYFDPPAARDPVTGGMECDPKKDLPPLSWKLVGKIVAALTAAAILLFAVWFIVRYLARRVKEHRMSPIERARVELDRLLRKGLPGKGRYKDFYVELTMVVRRYVQRKYGIQAPHMTTEEFFREFEEWQDRQKEQQADCSRKEGQEGFGSREQRARLKEFLESADMVKFAGVEATIEMATAATTSAKGYLETDAARA